jgi:hypothetical protein
VTVDTALHIPPVGLEAPGDVLRERDARGPVDRDAVVVVDRDQPAEAEVPGQRRRLGGHALHDVAVARERVGAVVNQVGSEARGQQPFRERHPDRVAQSLAQRSGRGLHSRRVSDLRVTGRDRAELAEPSDLVHRERVAREVQQRVEQHRAVAGREHEAVAVEPVRILGIVLQELAEEDDADLGAAERQPDVSDPRRAHGVDGEDADRRSSAGDGGVSRRRQVAHDGLDARRTRRVRP